MTSSRGHVRIEPVSPYVQWIGWGIAALAVMIVAILIVTQFVLPRLEDETSSSDNRTWLEFEWARAEVNTDAVNRLGERLEEHGISLVYLEGAAWRTDGSLVPGEHAAEFVQALRTAYPEVKILLWLRMSFTDIASERQRSAAVDLVTTSMQTWGLDGVQLNGRAIPVGSESFIQMLRDLRAVVGSGDILSVTAPPDRVPADPDVPIGTTVDPDLTWDLNYKQRVGLVGADEMVVMAHASGLGDQAQYQTWVAYQVEAYAGAVADLDHPPDIIVAVPTYEQAPEHDPAVEDVRTAINGVKAGIEQAGDQGALVKGIGLYEYKTTDSLEWAHYRELWLGKVAE